MTTAPMAIPAMDNSVGAFLIGGLLSVFLAGVTSVQAWEYFQNFGKSDRKYLVALVSFLLVCDVFHTAISCYTIYLWLVSNYGNLAILVKSPWSFTWDPFMCGIVAFSVQAFYAYRVFVISKKNYALTAVIGVLSLLSLAFAVGSTWEIYILDSKFSRFGEFRYGVLLWLFSAASADVLITGSLIFYLKRASRGDHQRSSSMVSRILLVTVETNGLTCLFAIADAILFAVVPDQSWHVIPNLSLVKLYFNGVLVSLNCRKSLKFGSQIGNSGDYVPHGLITSALQEDSYGMAKVSASPSSGNEKRRFAGLGLKRSQSRKSGEQGRAADAVEVQKVVETVSCVSNSSQPDLEKGDSRFAVSHAPHPHNDSSSTIGPVPTIAHAYTASISANSTHSAPGEGAQRAW